MIFLAQLLPPGSSPLVPWWEMASAFSAPIVILGGIGMYFVRSTVRIANAEQLEIMQKVFIPSMSSNTTGAELVKDIAEAKADLSKLRADIIELSSYAHGRIHDLANVMQVQVLTAEVEKLKVANSTLMKG